jgi:hypothetical protein
MNDTSMTYIFNVDGSQDEVDAVKLRSVVV